MPHRFLRVLVPAALLLASTAIPSLAAPGDLDDTFGDEGVALSAIGDEGAVAIALQADGRILTATLANAAGDEATLRITRFTSTGDVDATFGSGGTASVVLGVDRLTKVRALLRQSSDSKIVVGGHAIDAFSVTRLTNAGALDAGFATGGTATTRILGDDEVFALAQQADGRILAAGRADDGSDSDFAIVRYTTAGQPDGSFSGDGIQTVDFGGEDVARAVAVQGDGSIVVAGVTVGNTANIALARLTSSGGPDVGFGNSGKVTTSVSAGDDGAWAVLVQGDGRIVVAGDADGDFVLVRYTSTGELDAGFGTGGIARTDVSSDAHDSARALVRQGDGKLVAAGIANPGRASDFALVRYTAGGQPDSTFGNGGIATTSVAATFAEQLTGLALQVDGRLVAAGASEDGSTTYQMIARYDGDEPTSACGDADGNGTIQASDALRVLRSAVGQPVTCEPVVCDVNANGSVQASDALTVLKAAVGQPVVLQCPAP